MATLVTQVEFAKMEDRGKSYITKLKQAGRLVMEGDKVNVEASRARIAATADPNRDDVKQRWEEQRREEQYWEEQRNNPETVKIGNRYQAARAVKEKFAAMSAKLDYERAIGKLVERTEVEAAVEDVTSIIRQALEQMPHRTAPELVGKTLDQIRATLKQDIHAALSEMEQEFSKRLNSIGAEE